jgi:hypothetical protein
VCVCVRVCVCLCVWPARDDLDLRGGKKAEVGPEAELSHGTNKGNCRSLLSCSRPSPRPALAALVFWPSAPLLKPASAWLASLSCITEQSRAGPDSTTKGRTLYRERTRRHKLHRMSARLEDAHASTCDLGSQHTSLARRVAPEGVYPSVFGLILSHRVRFKTRRRL